MTTFLQFPCAYWCAGNGIMRPRRGTPLRRAQNAPGVCWKMFSTQFPRSKLGRGATVVYVLSRRYTRLNRLRSRYTRRLSIYRGHICPCELHGQTGRHLCYRSINKNTPGCACSLRLRCQSHLCKLSFLRDTLANFRPVVSYWGAGLANFSPLVAFESLC